MRAERHVGERIEARAVFVQSLRDRRVWYSYNADRVRSVASLSKLMAVLVVVERHLKLEGVTVLSKVDRNVASGGCRSRLRIGARYRNIDLLHAALLGSDNAAVSALGRAVSLDTSQLVAAMNRRAVLMGLKHTRFVDPVGINTGNVSTAREISSILKATLSISLLRRVMQKAEHYLHAVWPRNHRINYLNTNLLVHRQGFRVLGGKTGFNHKAGYCLATAASYRSIGPFAAVVLGSRSKLTRFRDLYKVMRMIGPRIRH